MTEKLIYLNGELYHASDFTEEELVHYGVKGMKWGKRTLRKNNKQVLNKYNELIKKSSDEYDRNVGALKAKRKSGEIDRATYKAGKRKELTKFMKDDDRYYSEYRDGIERNVKQRKEAIKNNRARLESEVRNYRNEQGRGYRKLLNNNINAARANGLSRTQSLRNAYTYNYTKERIYNR